MKRTVFGMATLLLLGATPCVVNAFTAIAWSESGQRGGSVKQAPTKDAAMSAAIADCKKNGGGSDCQVFKVTDEPGFVALYASCAKTCGVTAVTGRATAEQARADGKRDCEAHYRNTCLLAQEWEEIPLRSTVVWNDVTFPATGTAAPASKQVATTVCFVKDNPCACVGADRMAFINKAATRKVRDFRKEPSTYEGESKKYNNVEDDYYDGIVKQLSAVEIICAFNAGEKTNNYRLKEPTATAMYNRHDVASEGLKHGYLNKNQFELLREQNRWQ